LPLSETMAQALALGAALREALAATLGADAREIGVGADLSTGPSNDKCFSAFLFDRAAGGAGLATRLGDMGLFRDCLSIAARRLDCPAQCEHGCPACVLRPDLNYGDTRLDRPGGLALAQALLAFLDLPEGLRRFGPETELLGMPLAAWLEQRRRIGKLSSVTLFLHGEPANWEVAAWSVERLLSRLSDLASKPRLVLATAAFSDRSFDLARKLDLHRLAAHATLALSDALPRAMGAPVLAIVREGDRETAIAATNDVDARLGPSWGLGELAPLVRGPAPALPPLKQIDSSRLIELSGGNARLVFLRDRVDGPAASFGKNFWKQLVIEAPLTLAAIGAHGVASAHYTDRYLLTPVSLALLARVLDALPGARNLRSLSIETAQSDDRSGTMGRLVFHAFADDRQRSDVMRSIWPQGKVVLRPKSESPHARSLCLGLGDGRIVTIQLDQGFGSWRTTGAPPRHDFQAAPAAQARAILAAAYSVASDAHETPLALWEDTKPGCGTNDVSGT